ncbi:unnamed protein product [Rotaria sordida]|uniref:Nuclear receptor domain-containing protein n=1 Tax=Rotaria sordida TaxID=392033 RepID=A0A819Z6S6_9BILA|nr:unnamed protein product [Rotaria sordida]
MTTTTELSLTTSSKRRRIMIITGDEDVLKQIRLGGMTPEVEPIVVEFNDATQNTSHLTAEMQASVNQKKSNSRTLTCVVCGGTAHGYNFDAITCASCKAFFRRNAYKDPEELKCEGNHDCQINFALPRRCSACRLIKCLNSGMRRDRLLTDQQRADRRQKIEENRRVTLNSPRNQSVPSQIPDFVQLNIDDKMTLIKYNLIPIFILNASLCYKLDAEQFIEADSDAPCDAKDIQKYHGIDLSLKLKKIVSALCKIGQFDERIIQLSLVILLYTKGFSTMKSENEPILNDGMTVFRVQSYYAELLWKYLEMNHGSNKALRIFNTLVSHFVAIQNLNRALYNNLQDTLSPLDIEHMLPIMKTLLLFS